MVLKRVVAGSYRSEDGRFSVRGSERGTGYVVLDTQRDDALKPGCKYVVGRPATIKKAERMIERYAARPMS